MRSVSGGAECPVPVGHGTVAVVIPVYNGEAFIRRAVDSVLRQTHPAAQIVVVDDGSRDRTREILAGYGPAVTVLEQKNGGPSRARNAGLRVATAEFVAFLDADDWWEPEKLERQLAAFERQPGAAANYTGLRMVREPGGEIESEGLPAQVESLWPQLRWCNPGITPSCVMVRRDALEKVGGFNERQIGGEDWCLWIDLLGIGGFCACAESLTNYRVSAGGLCGDARLMFDEFMKMLDDVLLRDLSGLRRAVWRRRIVSYQAYKGVLTARAAGQQEDERAFVWKSLAAWPSPLWARERFKAFAVTLLRTRGGRGSRRAGAAGVAAKDAMKDGAGRS